jgi:HEAT repeat protein
MDQGGNPVGVSVSTEKLVSAAAFDLINTLKMALAQLRLYPKDSPQVANALAAAYLSVTAYLEQTPTLALAATPNGLLINGQRLGAKNFATVTVESSLISFFLDAAIKSIVFRAGVTADEFATFLDALVRKFGEIKGGKEINRFLQEHQVTRIAVDEIEYVAVGEGDLVIKDATRVLEKSGSQVGEIVKTLEHLVEASTDPRLGAEGRLEIMRKLLEQDPMLLEKARAEPLARDSAEKMPGLLPLEKGRECVGEIVRLLQAAPEALRPGLRKVGHLVIEAFQHDPRLTALMSQFLSAEAQQLIPAGMTENFEESSEENGPEARAKTLLALAADAQAEPLMAEAPALLPELLAIFRGDLAARVLARLTSVLMDRVTDRRRKAAEALQSLHTLWTTEPLAAARDGFEGLLRSALEAEHDAETYSKMIEIAVILADERLRAGEPERALETLTVFRRHYATKDLALAFRPEVVFRAMERITRSTGFPAVVTSLRSGDPVALRLAESLGPAVAAYLVEEMKKTELTTQRLPLAEVLARIGPDAASLLSDELQRATAPTDALRLLEVLPHAAPEAVASVALASTLHHPVSAVRRRSAAILTERVYPRSAELLLQALKNEKDPTIRATIVEGLGKLRASPAFEALAALADSRSESDELRATACLALARLGHAEAVPILTGIASKGSRGLGILKTSSPALRSAAVRALGLFPTNAAAREALKKLVDDSDPALQATARETLFRPVQKALAAPDREPAPAGNAVVQEVRPANVKLSGSLQEIPLDQVCQLVGGSEKTGLLMLSLEGRVGCIWFEQGQVVAADFERTKDQEAINGMARHKKGDFIFQPGERPPARRVQIPVPQALLEAFRVTDEGRK